MKHYAHNEKTNTVTILDDRFYLSEKTKEYYPSVTTILDAYPKGFGFTKWLKETGFNADEIVRKAGEEGVLVHDLIESYLLDISLTWYTEGEPKYKYHIWQMLCRFDEFWKTYNPEVIALESNLVSDNHTTGGRLDLVCKINDKVWLIDFKSSNALYRSHELQLSAYASMWNETEVGQSYIIDHVGVLWLKAKTRGVDKTEKKMQGKGWSLVEPKNHYTDDFKMFCKVRDIWFDANTVNPQNIELPNELSIKN